MERRWQLVGLEGDEKEIACYVFRRVCVHAPVEKPAFIAVAEIELPGGERVYAQYLGPISRENFVSKFEGSRDWFLGPTVLYSRAPEDVELLAEVSFGGDVYLTETTPPGDAGLWSTSFGPKMPAEVIAALESE